MDFTNWKTVISFTAILVATLSLILTFVQFRYQRIHYRKTVKPLGRVRIGDYTDKIFVGIENKGIGPLIIKEIISKRAGVLSKQAFYNILPEDLFKKVIWKNYTASYEGRAIQPGETFELLVWVPRPSDDLAKEVEIRSSLRKALSECVVELYYTDIYEIETFEHKLVFNEWFSRG